jgi:hypothetical protein
LRSIVERFVKMKVGWKDSGSAPSLVTLVHVTDDYVVVRSSSTTSLVPWTAVWQVMVADADGDLNVLIPTAGGQYQQQTVPMLLIVAGHTQPQASSRAARGGVWGCPFRSEARRGAARPSIADGQRERPTRSFHFSFRIG